GLVPVLMPHIREGRLRALAMTTPRRNPLLPDAPTMAESLPGFEVVSWEGMFAPPGTSREVIDRLNAATGAALKSREMRDAWAAKGGETVTGTPDALGAKLREDYEKT